MEKSGIISPNSVFELTAQTTTPARLDKFLTEQFPLYSRSFFSRLIDESAVQINGKPVLKHGTALKPNDSVTVTFPPEQQATSQAIAQLTAGVEILYTHEHFFILYKPAGLVMHKPSTHSTVPTLVDWLMLNHDEITDVGYADRPGIVHRLDKDTSGVLAIARTNYAHGIFTKLFHDREMSKTYHALVQGHPSQTGTIDMPIGRDPIHRHKMKAFLEKDQRHYDDTKNIRNAVTHYKVLEYFENHSLLEVKPVTGRTHQIRVHCAAIGHPIAGDITYGGKPDLIDRQALHAHTLSFSFDNAVFSISRDVPPDFEDLLKNLRAR